MSEQTMRRAWSTDLTEFCDRNSKRKTRLFVVDENGTREQEHGLPLNGITLGFDPAGSAHIDIMLGGRKASDSRHLVRTIAHVHRISTHSGLNGCDQLEIEDASGVRTVLDFGTLTGLGGE